MNTTIDQQIDQTSINFEALLEYCHGREDFAQKLINFFLLSHKKYLLDLESALVAEDVAGIRAICHKISGPAATIKADTLLELILAIRQDAVNGKIKDAQEKLVDVQKACSDISTFATQIGIPSE